MAALRLVEDGRIDLDRNINDYLTSWKLPENKYTKNIKVTLRMLLSHTAGLNVHGFQGYTDENKVPSLVDVLNGSGYANSKPVKVIRKPNTKWKYSGGGYTIVQQAMIDIEKKSFSLILDEKILNPLEMGAAGLLSTPADLAKLLIEVQRSKKNKSNKILSQKMIKKMLKPELYRRYAIGFEIIHDKVPRYFFHGGTNNGFKSKMYSHINDGYGAVVMTNFDEGGVISD